VRTAIAGVAVSLAIIAMKVIPGIPGSFTSSEWIAFGVWCGLGAMLFFSSKSERTLSSRAP